MKEKTISVTNRKQVLSSVQPSEQRFLILAFGVLYNQKLPVDISDQIQLNLNEINKIKLTTIFLNWIPFNSFHAI
jgi:hypothetical protein